jgi:acyl carrier protein
MKQDIEKTLRESIARQKMLSEDEISLDSSLEELGITSLDSISLVFDIEDKYGIEVPNEKLKQLRTVRDIVEGVNELLTDSRS